MTTKHILVRSLDHVMAVEALEDAPILAVIYPPDTIGGTDDPDLVARIREALADDYGVPYAPLFTGGLEGPAGIHDPDSLEWPTVMGASLNRQRLVGEPVGWGLPEPDPDEPPGRGYD
jgi:hypothetical protein